MIKLLTIIGTRPQFIKAAILSKLLSANINFEEVVLHTGQHYDGNMSAIFFEELGISVPKYNLNINQGKPGTRIGSMLIEIEKVILHENPLFILVYGDTNSTLAGALAGSKLHIPVVHVEAGMRSFDRTMPEEINRIVTDHCSSVLFCPSTTAVDNLNREGITRNVFEVGDVMCDSILFFLTAAEQKSNIMQKLMLHPKEYVLLTVHRASNTDNAKNIISILEGFLKSNEKVVFPIHPRTKKKMSEMGIWEKYHHKNIWFIEPVGYLDMISLEKNAKIIATDSGGVQKEACFLGVPCITLRDTTEWIETIRYGCNILVNTNARKIAEALQTPPKGSFDSSLYGNGKTSEKIVSLLNNIYK